MSTSDTPTQWTIEQSIGAATRLRDEPLYAQAARSLDMTPPAFTDAVLDILQTAQRVDVSLISAQFNITTEQAEDALDALAFLGCVGQRNEAGDRELLQRMKFPEWLNELERIAAPHGYTATDIRDPGYMWREAYYDTGHTPQQALEEDMKHTA